MSATLGERPTPVVRRQTRQRALIWAVLAEADGGHLSAADVELAVRATGASLHRATIYRTLDRLVDDGLLVRTTLGAEGSQYEIAHVHHHHLVCDDCGRVDHISHDAVRRAIGRIEADSGFELDGALLSLVGRCGGCRTTATG